MARTYHPRGLLIHGFSPRKHPFYNTWVNMLARCYDLQRNGYENYGGRGITVCERWHHFRHFAEDMWPRPEGLTLNRIDNDGNYEPGNCNWASRADQCVNRRQFRNNTTGDRGVVRSNAQRGGYVARFDYEGTRYIVGYFDDQTGAKEKRDQFVSLFFDHRAKALAMITPETVRRTSTTKHRGITPHKDGGFVARATKDGVRHYLGLFPTVEEAVRARETWIESDGQVCSKCARLTI